MGGPLWTTYRGSHRATEACVKLQLFTVESENRKPRFGDLEVSVNEWPADHPDIVVENTHGVAHPNVGWGHRASAVWHTEKEVLTSRSGLPWPPLWVSGDCERAPGAARSRSPSPSRHERRTAFRP